MHCTPVTSIWVTAAGSTACSTFPLGVIARKSRRWARPAATENRRFFPGDLVRWIGGSVGTRAKVAAARSTERRQQMSLATVIPKAASRRSRLQKRSRASSSGKEISKTSAPQTVSHQVTSFSVVATHHSKNAPTHFALSVHWRRIAAACGGRKWKGVSATYSFVGGRFSRRGGFPAPVSKSSRSAPGHIRSFANVPAMSGKGA